MSLRPGRSFAALALAGLLVAVLGLSFGNGLLPALGFGSHASALAAEATEPPTAGDSFTPELGLPASGVVAFGASPGEAPGEVWAYGKIGSAPVSVAGQSYSEQYALLQHTDAAGWQVLPLPLEHAGKPLAPAAGASGAPAEYGALAGQATTAGGVVLLSGQNVVVRDPGSGGQPRLAPTPPAITASQPQPKGVLAAGESLLPDGSSGGVTVPYAAIEDTAGDAEGPHTGVLIAPHDDGAPSSAGVFAVKPGVLHYDGTAWTREPIELSEEQEDDFTALALACGGTSAAPTSSSPENCWLLAGYRAGSGGRETNRLVLFRRVVASQSAGAAPVGESAGYEWVSQPVAGGLLGEQAQLAISPLAPGAQMLTATAQGVWVDFQAKIDQPAPGGQPQASSATELVLPTAGSPSGSPPALPAASVLGSWCYPTGPGCEQSLGAQLPAHYRSFAWAGAGESPGTRIITGLKHRAMLELAAGSFAYTVGAGGEAGEAAGGAAFTAPGEGVPAEGWIADDANPAAAADGAGQAQVIHIGKQPEGDQLQEEAVPFRRPLYALAQAPGTTPGDPNTPAVAVGELGQIGRYTPGQGWSSESLYDSAGAVKTPTLRGVAWPESGRIYAVGDEGAMWLWRAETGLWEPDPSEPLNFDGNLQAIAFSPSEPNLGYAVGRQGALLRHSKSWEQEPTCPPAGGELPEDCMSPELAQVNFTSIAFAGGEALATYRTLVDPPGAKSEIERFETGGLAIKEPGKKQPWHIDLGLGALLAQLPETQRVLSRVAGLPDGGAVLAGPGKVIEREAPEPGSPTGGWHFSAQPLPEAQNISALAAYRDSTGHIRAIVSADLDEYLNPERYSGGLEETPFKVDVPKPSGPGQPPSYLEPDVLPNSGYLLKETAGGWSDMEHDALPASNGPGFPRDMPARPDPVLALLVDPAGDSGLAVGGQTGDLQGMGVNPVTQPNNNHYQTAAAQRFPAGASSQDGMGVAPIATKSATASFIVGGQAACAQACSDFVNDGLGPEAWLTHALQMANHITPSSPGALRAFLYTGSTGGEDVFPRVLANYRESLPVDAAGHSTSVTVSPTASYYSYTTTGSSGPVQVIVLSFANGSLEAGEEEWLKKQLEAVSATPAIVVGGDSLGFVLPQQNSSSAGQKVQIATDASAVSRILVEGHASAYFFDYPGANVATTVTYGTKSISAYGTGTLGYVQPEDELHEADSLGSSGVLLAEVGARNPSTDIAPVSVRVVPNISQLALDATNGTFLRRSEVALFEALARRPTGGVAVEAGNGLEVVGPDPYDKIPFDCLGANCANEVPGEYTFTSSDPEIGGFVAHEAATGETRGVELGPGQLPVPDEPRNGKGELNPGGRFDENKYGEPVNERGEVVPRAASGLFCAYNTTYARNPKTGQTENKPITVSITTGGLTYSESVTIQAGSVEYPCGTVPLKNPPALEAPVSQNFNVPELPTAANPPPVSPHIQAIAPPPPPSPFVPAVVHPKPPHRPAALLPFVPLALPVLFPLRPVVPPPAPNPARPTPPSGTAPVSQTVGLEEQEQERESAIEQAHHMIALEHEQRRPSALAGSRAASNNGLTPVPANLAAYRTDNGPPLPSWPLGLVLIAVAGGVGVRRRPRFARLARIGVEQERDARR